MSSICHEAHLNLYHSPSYSYRFSVQSSLDFEKKSLEEEDFKVKQYVFLERKKERKKERKNNTYTTGVLRNRTKTKKSTTSFGRHNNKICCFGRFYEDKK